MECPHLSASEALHSFQFKLLLSPLSCTSAGTNAFPMNLATTAEDCWQYCNNHRYYSNVIANVKTQANSCLIHTGLQLPCRVNLFHSLWDTGQTVIAWYSLFPTPYGNSQGLTSQCWIPHEHQRTQQQERLQLSSLGFWLESVPLVCYCALFSPDLGIFYWHTGPG